MPNMRRADLDLRSRVRRRASIQFAAELAILMLGVAAIAMGGLF